MWLMDFFCNDFNCLYITGESDYRRGLEALGDDRDVWKFHFSTSFSFSLVEQLIGYNVWNTSKIGSVTLGLFESYLNNETLELFFSNDYIFLKREDDNSTWLFLDTRTGVVRDMFIYSGLLGTMPCYHDNITDNAWNYACNLLNKNSTAFGQLNVVAGVSYLSSVFLEAGVFLSEYLPILGELVPGGAGALGVAGIALFIVLCPDQANALWFEFAYLLNPEARDYPDIPIYEGTDLSLYYLFKDYNFTIIGPNDDDLNNYFNTILSKKGYPDKQSYDTMRRVEEYNLAKVYKLYNAGGPPKDSNPKNYIDVGKYGWEIYEEFKSAEGIDKLFVLKDNSLKIVAIYCLVFSESSFFTVVLYSVIQNFYGDNNYKN